MFEKRNEIRSVESEKPTVAKQEEPQAVRDFIRGEIRDLRTSKRFIAIAFGLAGLTIASNVIGQTSSDVINWATRPVDGFLGALGVNNGIAATAIAGFTATALISKKFRNFLCNGNQREDS